MLGRCQLLRHATLKGLSKSCPLEAKIGWRRVNKTVVLTRLVAGPPNVKHIDPTQSEVGRQRRDLFDYRRFQTSLIEFHSPY